MDKAPSLVVTTAVFFAVVGYAFAQEAPTPMFDDFMNFCVKTGAKPTAVKSAVEAEGGKLKNQGSTNWPFPMTTSIWRHNMAGQTLDISAGTMPRGGNSCVVTSYENGDASIAAIRKWAEVAPDRSSNGITHFAFLEFAPTRIPANEKSKRALEARVASGEWELVTVGTSHGASVQLSNWPVTRGVSH